MLRSQFDSHRHVKVLFFSIGVTYRETLGMLKPVTAPFPLLLPSGHSLMALLGGLWSRDPSAGEGQGTGAPHRLPEIETAGQSIHVSHLAGVYM